MADLTVSIDLLKDLSDNYDILNHFDALSSQTQLLSTIDSLTDQPDETCPKEFDSAFYDCIEEFLDAEGLFIALPSPAFSETKLTPLISLKKMSLKSVPRGILKINSGENQDDDEDYNKPLPTLLARRNSSERLASHPKEVVKPKSKFLNFKSFEPIERSPSKI